MKESRFWLLVIGWLILILITNGLISFGYDIYWGDALAGTYEYGFPLLFIGWIPLVIGIGLIPVDLVLGFFVIRRRIRERR